MRFQYVPFVILLLTAAMISMLLAFHAWRRRPASGLISFIALTVSIAVWSLSYALELISPTLSSKVFCAKLAFVGIVLVPVAWFSFVYQYTQKNQWLSRRNLTLLLVVPFITLILTWTNEFHGLIWTSNTLGKSGLLSIRLTTFGTWFWIHVIYSYSLLLLGAFQLVKAVLRSPQFYRGQFLPLLVAAIAPWGGNILFISGLSPLPNIDLTPFGFALTGVALAWSLFGYRLLDIMPVAREGVFENTNDLVIVLNEQQCIVDLNPAALQTLRQKATEVVGQPAHQVFSGLFDSVLRHLHLTETNAEVDLKRNGEHRFFELHLSPLRTRSGQLTGRLLILHEITERKLAEQVLQQSHNQLEQWVLKRTSDLTAANEKLRREIIERSRMEETLKDSLNLIGRAKREWESTVDSLPQLICLLDGKGNILRANRTIEKWDLNRVVNVKGMEVHQLLHPGCSDPSCYLTSFWPKVWEELARGNSAAYEMEDRIIKRYLDIQVRPILASSYRKGEETDSIAVVIVSDLTEKKLAEKEMMALEDQLLQSQKMEAIGRLAGGIAHDFNNLLTPIVGYSQLTLSALPASNPLREDILEIQKAADRATKLIRQLMTFSRRKPQKPQVINLNDILFEMDKMIRRLIGEHIELITLPAPDLGSVKVDPGQFEQVLVNLAVNARDAMPKGGKLFLETSNISFCSEGLQKYAGIGPGEYVRFTVRDTGMGMTEEIKGHIFEPFFTTKKQGEGTGLGLATVYGIVKQNNGHITVYSEPEKGTVFKIYLPSVREEATPLPLRDDVGYLPKGDETILLVEDEPLIRGFAFRVLREQGYRVIEASNGEEALRLFRDGSVEAVHLLFTDVVMPQMGGKELAERLRGLQPGLKVLFTSGYVDQIVINEELLASGIAFLEKPFTPSGLTRKVREVLDH